MRKLNKYPLLEAKPVQGCQEEGAQTWGRAGVEAGALCAPRCVRLGKSIPCPQTGGTRHFSGQLWRSLCSLTLAAVPAQPHSRSPGWGFAVTE